MFKNLCAIEYIHIYIYSIYPSVYSIFNITRLLVILLAYDCTRDWLAYWSVISPTAKILGSTWTRHRSDTFVSNRCLIDVDLKVFAFWDGRPRIQITVLYGICATMGRFISILECICAACYSTLTSHEQHGASTHRTLDCLFSGLCSLTSKKSSKLHIPVRGIHRWLVITPHNRPVMRKTFPYHIMTSSWHGQRPIRRLPMAWRI